MTCYHPIQGWKSKHLNQYGNRKIVFSLNDGLHDQPVTLPCGQCIGCRLERSRQWAVRCIHEAQLHQENCFITLTYNQDNLPADGSLNKADFQKFMKRLRKHFYPQKLRYYMCGEYGYDEQQPSKLGRPHFHACIFGIDFSDKELYKTTNDVRIYTSTILEKIWNKGFVTVGDVTFESAAYVARYIAKKITGDEADTHYFKINYETGEITQVQPEYNDMSRRPGIARDWWHNYHRDTFKDFITVNGRRMRPPKYYDQVLKEMYPDQFEIIKEKRKLESFENFDETMPKRLAVKEGIKQRKYKHLPRDLK